ncbi:hypothetical protein QYE76_009382 [Lolium multiflorum]|uniref:BHLH domain-containing protein n=1 Tax=Lolium multiflorum TaxID=4521 RepID=A0AAD8TV71_LOLMU|nr:hypothetical protein QYE76_009382 [Lolium multiflorum]
MLLLRRTQQPGNDLPELLWQNGPALQRTAAAPFPPFASSAAGTSTSGRSPELARRHPASATAMRDLLGAPDDDAVPWLHYPVMGGVDDDDSDTAPLPPEYCSTLLSGYPDLPAAVASRDAGGAPSTSHCAVAVPAPMPEPAVPRHQQQQPRPSGEGIMNFTFFSRPLQRAPPPTGERAPAAPSNPVESTVLQASTNRLRSTPLFSEQRMAWLQPPKDSRATVAPVPPPPPPPTPPVPIRQGEASAALAHRVQPEARAAPERAPPATATTSSVCSDNVDQSQLKRSSSSHQAPEWSVSQEDEDLDDEAGGLRRSAARSTKRGRTAEVHNMSERRRRDRINEKMRALQELIPNCNKIDKASMLEEAIEYLKTLQLQVQMMSTMGTAGLCMPPMLAMQHMQMQMPPMAHFHHHHLGPMGYGMGAFDPRLAAAAAGAAQFPYPMIPGMPMFGHGPAMPSPPPPFSQQAAAAGAQMAAGTVVDNEAAAQAEQQTSGEHPQVPRAM